MGLSLAIMAMAVKSNSGHRLFYFGEEKKAFTDGLSPLMVFPCGLYGRATVLFLGNL